MYKLEVKCKTGFVSLKIENFDEVLETIQTINKNSCELLEFKVSQSEELKPLRVERIGKNNGINTRRIIGSVRRD